MNHTERHYYNVMKATFVATTSLRSLLTYRVMKKAVDPNSFFRIRIRIHKLFFSDSDSDTDSDS
jgi:hypothetical protein